jgi:hypothetical protein
MSRARNLADLLDANGDVASGALDNVPPSNDASALTTGTLPVERVPYVGRRNLIINGGFQVWQRSTSGSGNGYKSADRWYNNFYNSGTCTTSIRTDATGQNFTTYARVEQSSAGVENDMQAIFQNIEGTYAVGKTITVSFTARASKTLATCRVRQCFSTPQTFTLTTDWQRFTFTGTAVAYGSNTRVNIDLGLNNDTWYADIAEVQLEVGSVATPFEHRSYGEELALCQRYYYQIGDGSNSEIVGVGGNFGTDWAYFSGAFPTTMRTTPTVSVNNSTYFRCHSTTGGGIITDDFDAPSEISNKQYYVSFSGVSSFTAGAANLCFTSNNTGSKGIIKFDSEL